MVSFRIKQSLVKIQVIHNSKILVGAVAHFEKHLLSETEAQSKANLLQNGQSQKKMKGSDVAILNLVRDLVDENDRKKQQALMQGMSSAMIGMGTVSPPEDFTSEEQLTNLRCEITKQQNDGGSVAQSLALHIACEKNAVKIVRLLLQIDATSVSVKDHLGRTPLINAAINAGVRLSINGIDDTVVVDSLVNAGANKRDVDLSNMTAYGHFKQSSSSYMQITRYEHRHKLTNLEHKLYPPGGPSLSDFSEGKGGSSGLVDYGPEDDEADREMGRGAYADGSDY